MYDSIVLALFLAAIVGTWLWLAGRMKRGGKGPFLCHFVGSTVGIVAGLVVVTVAVSLGVIKPKDGHTAAPAQVASQPSGVAEISQPAYTVIKDEYKRDIKRTVVVQLAERVTKDQLTALAAAIKATATQKTNLTFIGYRLVDGDAKGAYWATTHYTPDLEVSILGLPLADYQTLSAIDIAKSYPDNKGAWLRDLGSMSHVMVLYQKGGKFFIDQLFANGGKNTEAYGVKKLADGSLRLEEPENSFKEYYVVKTDGTLEGWGEGGRYLTLHSLEVAR
ncbi:zinc ribbon domain-containing protein [Pseudomonas aeruginosa]|uniref:zinc ribbon domain-containing protein n=1 Tax=Pseudomonas aeruginosa TaxID=287 RepID=UPI0021F1404C|nr:zinc ribbon domain-containing protein [Pseudomonas aeruginosa]MCV6429387.1 zinc ribbon domain-containing protein [Pseudomonas aeruginosa]MCV6437381.1 zinc ribbon domain-containing protein [Pseudomonas aeruginosa]